MYICDYITDIGIVYKFYRPYIYGINRSSGVEVESGAVLLGISGYVSVEGYRETDAKRSCSKIGRGRRLRLSVGNILYDVEYWRPFVDLDWSVFDGLAVKAETIPERLSDGDLNIILRTWH
jgi:hypothetical protein